MTLRGQPDPDGLQATAASYAQRVSPAGHCAADRAVVSLANLQHRLWDPERGQEFVVMVDRLEIHTGSFVAILGPNACGKTTILTVLGLLRRPTDVPGQLEFLFRVQDGAVSRELNIVDAWNHPAEIERVRRRHLGFALQSGELLTALTVRENIALPLHLNGVPPREIDKRVNGLLHGFDLMKGSQSNRLPDSRVNKLSGGEYQRVALARAIAHRPDVVFVDEPTASLNHQTARVALNQLRTLQGESGGRTAVVMITHDRVLAYEFADTIMHMEAAGPTAGGLSRIEPNEPTHPMLCS